MTTQKFLVIFVSFEELRIQLLVVFCKVVVKQPVSFSITVRKMENYVSQVPTNFNFFYDKETLFLGLYIFYMLKVYVSNTISLKNCQ